MFFVVSLMLAVQIISSLSSIMSAKFETFQMPSFFFFLSFLLIFMWLAHQFQLFVSHTGLFLVKFDALFPAFPTGLWRFPSNYPSDLNTQAAYCVKAPLKTGVLFYI